MRSQYNIDNIIKNHIDSLQFQDNGDGWEGYIQKRETKDAGIAETHFARKCMLLFLLLLVSGIGIQLLNINENHNLNEHIESIEIEEIELETPSVPMASLNARNTQPIFTGGPKSFEHYTTLPFGTHLPDIRFSNNLPSHSSLSKVESGEDMSLQPTPNHSVDSHQLINTPDEKMIESLVLPSENHNHVVLPSRKEYETMQNSLPILKNYGVESVQSNIGVLPLKPILKHKTILPFAELAYHSSSGGLTTNIGAALKIDGWQAEFGTGVQLRHKHVVHFSEELPSNNFANENNLHNYKLSQMANLTVTSRIRKLFGTQQKHGIFLGIIGKKNITNQIETQSEIVTTDDIFNIRPSGSETSLKYQTVNESYSNARNASTISRNVNVRSFGLDLFLGYEYKLPSAAFFIQFTKPVMPTFDILNDDNSKVLFQSFDIPSVGVGFRYYI